MKPIRVRAAWRHGTACLLAMSAAPAATAAETVTLQNTVQYREPAPKALLRSILAKLRRTLPDIYSMRDMRLCPAKPIELNDGQPTEWSVRFEHNAKYKNGGYTGIQRDLAIFSNKRIAYLINKAKQFGREGLDGLSRETVYKQMAVRTRIANAAVQQALPAVQ